MMHEARVLERIDRAANDNLGKVKAKPDLKRIIRKTLGDHVRFDARQNFLLSNGGWRPASLTEIMQAVNRKRKALGYTQITIMEGWCV